MTTLKQQIPAQWTAWLFAIGTLIIGTIPSSLTFMLDTNAATRMGLGEIPIPAPIFIIVWLIAYPCMGIATWLIWQQRDDINFSIPFAIFTAGFLSTLSFWLTNGIHMTAVLDGIVLMLACTVAFVYFQYDKRTIWWLMPWLIWMPITFAFKLWAVTGGI